MWFALSDLCEMEYKLPVSWLLKNLKRQDPGKDHTPAVWKVVVIMIESHCFVSTWGAGPLREAVFLPRWSDFTLRFGVVSEGREQVAGCGLLPFPLLRWNLGFPTPKVPCRRLLEKWHVQKPNHTGDWSYRHQHGRVVGLRTEVLLDNQDIVSWTTWMRTELCKTGAIREPRFDCIFQTRGKVLKLSELSSFSQTQLILSELWETEMIKVKSLECWAHHRADALCYCDTWVLLWDLGALRGQRAAGCGWMTRGRCCGLRLQRSSSLLSISGEKILLDMIKRRNKELWVLSSITFSGIQMWEGGWKHLLISTWSGERLDPFHKAADVTGMEKPSKTAP